MLLKATLQNGYVYIIKPKYVSSVLCGTDIDVQVTLKGYKSLNKYRCQVSYAGITKDFVENFVIKYNEINQAKYLDLVFNLTDVVTDNTITFVSDKVPLTRALLLGQSVEEAYGGFLTALEKRLSTVERAVIELSEEGELL